MNHDGKCALDNIQAPFQLNLPSMIYHTDSEVEYKHRLLKELRKQQAMTQCTLRNPRS